MIAEWISIIIDGSLFYIGWIWWMTKLGFYYTTWSHYSLSSPSFSQTRSVSSLISIPSPDLLLRFFFLVPDCSNNPAGDIKLGSVIDFQRSAVSSQWLIWAICWSGNDVDTGRFSWFLDLDRTHNDFAVRKRTAEGSSDRLLSAVDWNTVGGRFAWLVVGNFDSDAWRHFEVDLWL